MRQHILIVYRPDGFPSHSLHAYRTWLAVYHFLRWRGLGRLEWTVQKRGGQPRRIL